MGAARRPETQALLRFDSQKRGRASGNTAIARSRATKGRTLDGVRVEANGPLTGSISAHGYDADILGKKGGEALSEAMTLASLKALITSGSGRICSPEKTRGLAGRRGVGGVGGVGELSVVIGPKQRGLSRSARSDDAIRSAGECS